MGPGLRRGDSGVGGAQCGIFGTTGKSVLFAGIVSRLKFKNISLYRNSDLRYVSAQPAPPRGTFARSSRNVVRVAMGRCGVSCFSPDETLATDGEVVWSWRRDRGVQVGARYRADDGGKKRRSPGRVRISRKTIARGKPGCLGCTCSFYPVCESTRDVYGCIQRPASLRPLRFRGTTRWQNLRHLCRGNAFGCLKSRIQKTHLSSRRPVSAKASPRLAPRGAEALAKAAGRDP
jgi:hypothetical protein